MNTFEIYFDDLSEEAKARYIEFIGGREEVQEIVPLASIEREDEENE